MPPKKKNPTTSEVKPAPKKRGRPKLTMQKPKRTQKKKIKEVDPFDDVENEPDSTKTTKRTKRVAKKDVGQVLEDPIELVETTDEELEQETFKKTQRGRKLTNKNVSPLDSDVPSTPLVVIRKIKDMEKVQNRMDSSKNASLNEVATKKLNTKKRAANDKDKTDENVEFLASKKPRHVTNDQDQNEFELDSSDVFYQSPLKPKDESATISRLQEEVKRLEMELKLEIENSKSLSLKVARFSGTKSAKMDELDSNKKNTQEVRLLYEDLSGLLIRDVKVSKEEKTFDCIHSGRNGTMHFKLIFTPNDDLWEYQPKLDKSRDQQLLETLPDYLVEDLNFTKEHLGLFFWRLLNFLNKESDEMSNDNNETNNENNE